MIYDAHCHLDLMDNMSGIITEMLNSDISLFAVGTTPKAYDREVQFCRNNPHIINSFYVLTTFLFIILFFF